MQGTPSIGKFQHNQDIIRRHCGILQAKRKNLMRENRQKNSEATNEGNDFKEEITEIHPNIRFQKKRGFTIIS